MIPRWANTQVYSLFNEFIEKTVLSNDSFLTEEKDVITTQSVDDCINRFIVKIIKGKDSFENKIEKQFSEATYETILTFAHVNWLWCMAPSDFGVWYKRNVAANIIGDAKKADLREDIYPDGGFGDAGPSIKFRKHKEISFLLLVIKQLKIKVASNKITDINEANAFVENMCIESMYNWDNQNSDIVDQEIWELIPEGKLAMYNILLHLSNPEKYEPIASDGHKNRIVNAFRIFLKDAPKNIQESNRDEKLIYIRQEITKINDNEEFTFYDEEFRKIWNYNLLEEGFSVIQGLLYKKAIILYGPPGTSKTYSATKLASALITEEYLSDVENVEAYFKGEENFEEGRIHNLQLHANYNYEDFVAGIQLKGNETVATKGKLFDICKLAEDDKDGLPHVLILDEINRVDLSRLFGEVFSALENRGKPIELSIGNFKLSIPENLYVIGTMNEIDFSLEQIDFALRRRFVWRYYGFNEYTLKEIIKKKDKKLKTRLNDQEIDLYISKCINLNEKLIELPELGKQYEIGHTFFAEVVDILASYVVINNYSRIQKKIYRNEGPAKIVWDISIEPMISAFLGNMDKNTKKDKLEELRLGFIYE